MEILRASWLFSLAGENQTFDKIIQYIYCDTKQYNFECTVLKHKNISSHIEAAFFVRIVISRNFYSHRIFSFLFFPCFTRFHELLGRNLRLINLTMRSRIKSNRITNTKTVGV